MRKFIVIAAILLVVMFAYEVLYHRKVDQQLQNEVWQDEEALHAPKNSRGESGVQKIPMHGTN